MFQVKFGIDPLEPLFFPTAELLKLFPSMFLLMKSPVNPFQKRPSDLSTLNRLHIKPWTVIVTILWHQ